MSPSEMEKSGNGTGPSFDALALRAGMLGVELVCLVKVTMKVVRNHENIQRHTKRRTPTLRPISDPAGTAVYLTCNFVNMTSTSPINRVTIYRELKQNTNNGSSLGSYVMAKDSLYVNAMLNFFINFTLTNLMFNQSLSSESSPINLELGSLVSERVSSSSLIMVLCVTGYASSDPAGTAVYLTCNFVNMTSTPPINRVTIYRELKQNTNSGSSLGSYVMAKDSLYVNAMLNFFINFTLTNLRFNQSLSSESSPINHELVSLVSERVGSASLIMVLCVTGYARCSDPAGTAVYLTCNFVNMTSTPPINRVTIYRELKQNTNSGSSLGSYVMAKDSLYVNAMLNFFINFTLTNLMFNQSLSSESSPINHELGSLVSERVSSSSLIMVLCVTGYARCSDPAGTAVYLTCNFVNMTSTPPINRVTIYRELKQNTNSGSSLGSYVMAKDSLYVNAMLNFFINFTLTNLRFNQSLSSESSPINHELVSLVSERVSSSSLIMVLCVTGYASSDPAGTAVYLTCNFVNMTSTPPINRVTIYRELKQNTNSGSSLGSYVMAKDSLYVNAMLNFFINFTLTNLMFNQSLSSESNPINHEVVSLVSERVSSTSLIMVLCETGYASSDPRGTAVYLMCSFRNDTSMPPIDRVTVYRELKQSANNYTSLGPYSMASGSLYVNGMSTTTPNLNNNDFSKNMLLHIGSNNSALKKEVPPQDFTSKDSTSNIATRKSALSNVNIEESTTNEFTAEEFLLIASSTKDLKGDIPSTDFTVEESQTSNITTDKASITNITTDQSNANSSARNDYVHTGLSSRKLEREMGAGDFTTKQSISSSIRKWNSSESNPAADKSAKNDFVVDALLPVESKGNGLSREVPTGDLIMERSGYSDYGNEKSNDAFIEKITDFAGEELLPIGSNTSAANENVSRSFHLTQESSPTDFKEKTSSSRNQNRKKRDTTSSITTKPCIKVYTTMESRENNLNSEESGSGGLTTDDSSTSDSSTETPQTCAFTTNTMSTSGYTTKEPSTTEKSSNNFTQSELSTTGSATHFATDVLNTSNNTIKQSITTDFMTEDSGGSGFTTEQSVTNSMILKTSTTDFIANTPGSKESTTNVLRTSDVATEHLSTSDLTTEKSSAVGSSTEEPTDLITKIQHSSAYTIQEPTISNTATEKLIESGFTTEKVSKNNVTTDGLHITRQTDGTSNFISSVPNNSGYTTERSTVSSFTKVSASDLTKDYATEELSGSGFTTEDVTTSDFTTEVIDTIYPYTQKPITTNLIIDVLNTTGYRTKESTINDLTTEEMTASGAPTEEVSTTYFTTDGLHTNYSTIQNPTTTNLTTHVQNTTGYSTKESTINDLTTEEMTASGAPTEEVSTTYFTTDRLHTNYSTIQNPTTTNLTTHVQNTTGYSTKESTINDLTTEEMTASGAPTEEVSTTYFTTDRLHTNYSTIQNSRTTNLITDVHNTTYSTKESKFSDFTTKELITTGFATEKQSTTHFTTNASRNTYLTTNFTTSNSNTSSYGTQSTISASTNISTSDLAKIFTISEFTTDKLRTSTFTTEQPNTIHFTTEEHGTSIFITDGLKTDEFGTTGFTIQSPNTRGFTTKELNTIHTTTKKPKTTNFITDIVGTSGYNTKEPTQRGFTTDESSPGHTENPKTIKPTTKAQNISGYTTKESTISELTAQTSDFQTEMASTIHSVVTASSKHTLDASSASPTPTQNASLTTLNNTLSPSDYTETFSSTQHGPTVTPLTLSQTTSLLLSEPVYSPKVSVDGPDTTATSSSAHSVSTLSLTTSRMATLERTINVLSDSTSSSTPPTNATISQPTLGQTDLSSSPRIQNTATTSFFHDPTTLATLPAITSTDATASFTDSLAVSSSAFTLSSGNATYMSPTFASSTVNQRTTTVLSNSVTPLSSLVSTTTQSVGTLHVYTSATTPTGLPTSITTSAHSPFAVTQTTTPTSSSQLSPALPSSSTLTHSSTTSFSTLLTTSSSSTETTTTLLSTSLPHNTTLQSTFPQQNLTSPSNTFSPALSNSVLSSTHIQTDTASSTKVPQTLASTSTSIAFQSSPTQFVTYTPLVSISSSTTNHPATSSVSQTDKILPSTTTSKEMSSAGFPTNSISSSLSSSKSPSTSNSQTTTIMSNATTSATPTTSISPPVIEPNDRIFAIGFTIVNINFASDLSNPNSTLYKELEYNITLQLTALYKKSYLGRLLKYVKVTRFRKGSVIVDCTCVFSTNDSLLNVSTSLNGTSVRDIFISAINGSNDLGAMYLLNPNSLTVQEQTTTSSTVTTTTVLTTSVTNIPVINASDKRFIINFTIINLNFTSDLNNSSSALYKNLESNITAQTVRSSWFGRRGSYEITQMPKNLPYTRLK
ncbi:MUC16 protein, partial [Polypterus senegalus]